MFLRLPGTSTLDLLGIKTIPVIRYEDHIKMALATMDIQLNPGPATMLLEFTASCRGMAHVFIATGMYVGSNGRMFHSVFKAG